MIVVDHFLLKNYLFFINEMFSASMTNMKQVLGGKLIRVSLNNL